MRHKILLILLIASVILLTVNWLSADEPSGRNDYTSKIRQKVGDQKPSEKTPTWGYTPSELREKMDAPKPSGKDPAWGYAPSGFRQKKDAPKPSGKDPAWGYAPRK